VPFVLETAAEPKKLYCGPDIGWLEITPPPPPTPEEQAMKFATKQEADDYAKKYGIKAYVIEV